MLEGLKKIAEGVKEISEPINPFITDMTDKNKEIATNLLSAGYSVKDVQNFVDVSRTQLDDFLEIEEKVFERMGKITKKEDKKDESAGEKNF